MSEDRVFKNLSIVPFTPLNEEESLVVAQVTIDSECPSFRVPSPPDQLPSLISRNSSQINATITGDDDTNKIPVEEEESAPEVKPLKSIHEMTLVSIEDCTVSEQASTSEHVGSSSSSSPFPTNQQPVLPTTTTNNNCMALIPIPTNKQVPVALLGKSSSNQDESPGGIMQLITGINNRVSPAANPDTVQTVGAVLMIIPKKSDNVCINLQQDQENNLLVENQNCGNSPAFSGPVENAAILLDSEHAVVKPAQSYDSYEEVCRICHDNPTKLELISPCLCEGSMGKVHRTCLERWLGESAKNSCEICGYEYNTVRKPKYKGCRSAYQWIRHPLSPSDTRNLFFDIACFFVLTPLAIISTYLCVTGATYYSIEELEKRKSKRLVPRDPNSQGRNINYDMRDASNATWTSVGLFSLTGTLIAAYCIWLFVAVRYHVQIWKEWQQRNFTVTIIPFEDGCMGRPPPPRPRTARDPATDNNNGGSDSVNYGLNNAVVNNNIPLIYSSGTRGRVYSRPVRFSGNANVPGIFSRSHFLRNAHPGYTISETTLMYQAIYGSDSDSALFNENLLALLAESSEDMLHERDTESSSVMIVVPNLAEPEKRETEMQNTSANLVQETKSKHNIHVDERNENIVIPSVTPTQVHNPGTSLSCIQIQCRQEQLDITKENASQNPHVTIIVEDDQSKNDKEGV